MLPELSLNDEAVQDLHPTDVVVDEGTPQPAPVIEVEVGNQEEEVDHADAITKELENYDVTLQAVENGVAHYFKVDDVAKTILTAESIGQADAEQLAEQHDDFVEVVGHPREFSQQPSKTNLKPALQFLEDKVKTQGQLQCDALTNFMAKDLERVKVIVMQMKDNQIDELKELLEGLRVKALADLDRVVKSRYYFIPNKEQTRVIDLRRTELTGNIGEEGIDAGILPPKSVLRQFDEMVRSPATRRIFKTAEYGWGLPADRFFGQYDLDRITADHERFNYLELLAFLASHTFNEIIDDIVDVLEKVTQSFANPDAPMNQMPSEEGGVRIGRLAELTELSRDTMKFALAAWGSFSALNGFASLASVILNHMGQHLNAKTA